MADKLGLCECECGGVAPLAGRSNSKLGLVKGQPQRFINGHNRQGKRDSISDRLSRHIRFANDLSPNGMPGCIIWVGKKSSYGYGVVEFGRKHIYAHNVALDLAGVDRPDESEPDHLCRRCNCINIKHLEHVPHAENCRRGSNAKLSVLQVGEIRSLFLAGWQRHDIANAYGVTRGHVYKIATRAKWRNS